MPRLVSYTQSCSILRITVIERLPEDAQTLHAETLALLLNHEKERDWSHLNGSFSRKIVKGTEYLYFQYSDPGGTKRQFAIGKRSAALDALVDEHANARDKLRQNAAQLQRLVTLMRAAGVAWVPHGPARVLRALGDAGVFAAGGVLMGSYAFLVLGNQLGVGWPGATWRTQDIDIAGHVAIALPTLDADIPKALDSLQMGFVPVPEFDRKSPSTSFHVRGKPLRVDLLTPGSERDTAPIAIPRFCTAASPIKFLSLVMHGAQPAISPAARDTSLVAVPEPARFALHKLLVSQTRSTIQQTKSGKDLHQAALLLEVLAEDRPDDLETAARAFAESGPAVTRKVLRGLAAASKRWPEVSTAQTILTPLLEHA